MSRNLGDRIADILSAIDRCQKYAETAEKAETALIVEMSGDAIERNLQIIGEAVKALPPNIIDENPGIPWAEIRGFRNILVHEYFGLDMAVVKEVVDNNLPALRQALEPYRQKSG